MNYSKEELNKTGVYSILNLVNGKQYIGSAAQNFNKRWILHRSELKLNRHHSKYLQSSWNKYTEHLFQFVIIEYCEPDQCIAREQHYLDSLNVCDKEFGYNTCPNAGNCLGVKASDETKAKLSIVSASRRHSDEAKAKISLAGKGRKHTDEAKAKMSLAKTGIKISDEHRAKISLAVTGTKRSAETRAKIGLARKGIKLSDEHRAKVILANTGRKQTKEHIANAALGHQKIYIVTDPNNIETITNELKSFCLTNNLVYATMIRMANGVIKISKCGWKCTHKI